MATVDPEIAPNKPAGDDTGHAQPPGQPADQRIGHFDQLIDDRSGGHDVSTQNEKQHHHQRKVVHTAQQGLDQQKNRQVGKKKKTENRGKKQTHKNRNIGCHTTQQD